MYEAALEDAALLTDLDAAIWMIEDGDAAGRAWCQAEGFDGYTSYASLDDLPVRATPFGELATRLQNHAEIFAGDLAWDMQGRSLALDSLWVNILPPGGSHSGHIHPLSVLSGTIYITGEPGTGGLKLEDPSLGLKMAAPPLRKDAPEDRQRFFYVTPRPGLICLWESWLRHEVRCHRGTEPRLSISFNFALR